MGWLDGTGRNADGSVIDPPAGVDPSVMPPDGQHVLGIATGKGVQVYHATGSPVAWVLYGPDAQLFDGATQVGTHTVGPTWTALSDGSAIHGQKLAQAAGGSGNVPLLLLQVYSRDGDGVFNRVNFVQRLQTNGGVAPDGVGLDDRYLSSEARMTYQATYYFWGDPLMAPQYPNSGTATGTGEMLVISSDPGGEGAALYVNGARQDTLTSGSPPSGQPLALVAQVPPGTYAIRVWAPGFHSYTQDVTVVDGQRTEVDIPGLTPF